MNILVFDIETIPDVTNGRKLYELSDELTDQEVVNKMLELRREQTGGSDFLRHHMHQIVCISAVLASADKVKVWSLGETDSSEKELIQRFFDGIEKYNPILVSWNGGGFDLPTLHYRMLINGVAAPRYWEMGEEDQSFRWNNYLNRFHYRHMDLMDILSGYQSRAVAPLDDISIMLNLPGKMGMDGSKVWEAFHNGQIEQIRNYCETDVLNTYLVYLRFELIRGKLTETMYRKKCEQLREELHLAKQKHFDEFLERWKK